MGRGGGVNMLGDERDDRVVLWRDRGDGGRVVVDGSYIYALAMFCTEMKGIHEGYIPLSATTADVWWELMMKSGGCRAEMRWSVVGAVQLVTGARVG
jgi:hypothetical protein